MKSQRINGKGKEILSPPFRTQAEEWDVLQRGRHGLFPYPSCNDDDCSDDGFVQRGTGVIHSPVDGSKATTTWPDGRDYSGNHVPEDYDKYLKRVDHLNIGDYIVYSWHKPDELNLTLASIRCILFKMPREEMTWPRSQGWPKPWIVANCGGISNQNPNMAWVSYEDLCDHRLLTTGEYDRFVKNNVQLPDYIEQVKAAIKSGKLVVSR